MSTVPVPGGLVAVISVSESTFIVALALPKSTPVASVNPLPVMITLAPPALVPLVGEMADTCGVGAGGVLGGGVVGVGGPEIPRPVGVGVGVSGPEIPSEPLGGVVGPGMPTEAETFFGVDAPDSVTGLFMFGP